MHHLLTDLRSGVRMLVKYPTLSIVAVLTLGLGIGLSTTVFCVVNGGMFKGLPFPDGQRVVVPGRHQSVAATSRGTISVQDIAVCQAAPDVRSSGWARTVFTPINLSTEEGRPERFSGAPADGRRVRGARRGADPRPRLSGRRRSTGRRAGDPAGRRLWRDRFGSVHRHRRHGDPRQRRHRTVIGVMPREVRLPDSRSALDYRWRSIRWPSEGQGPFVPGDRRG